MTMFKGKVYMYSNVNGREEKLEREFDNPQDFQSFAQQMPAFSLWKTSPLLSLDGRSNFHEYVEHLLDRRLGL